jgi:predicted ATPase
MSARSEYDAAYFTMLRAIEERDDLLRYRDWLQEERERLDAFAAVTQTRTDALSRKVRRPMDLTTKPLLEAVGRRRAAVLDEQRRIDDRVAAAEAFVAECEQEVASLRR